LVLNVSDHSKTISPLNSLSFNPRLFHSRFRLWTRNPSLRHKKIVVLFLLANLGYRFLELFVLRYVTRPYCTLSSFNNPTQACG
jgi:hypothetical protein